MPHYIPVVCQYCCSFSGKNISSCIYGDWATGDSDHSLISPADQHRQTAFHRITFSQAEKATFSFSHVRYLRSYACQTSAGNQIDQYHNRYVCLYCMFVSGWPGLRILQNHQDLCRKQEIN